MDATLKILKATLDAVRCAGEDDRDAAAALRRAVAKRVGSKATAAGYRRAVVDGRTFVYISSTSRLGPVGRRYTLTTWSVTERDAGDAYLGTVGEANSIDGADLVVAKHLGLLISS